jgi:hypothetical protein
MGWNDRISAYLSGIRKEPGCAHLTALTSFDLIEQTEDREPPAMR